MAPRSFFSRAAVASWRARYFGFSNVCHSQRANPHISADGTITASSRWAGRKNRLPLVPQLARKTLMPLLSEMPAVSRKSSTVCSFVSCALQVPSRDVEGEEQRRGRKAEMVGDAERHHRVGEGEEEQGEQ